MTIEVRQREIGAQFVLTEQRQIGAAGLADWLGAAMKRLGASAHELGGLTGPWFVVYHGQVTGENEVPVEVCAPIAPEREGTTGVPARREPAHREAYARLTKAQVTPERMGAVFGEVAAWVAKAGFEIADAPREVYFTDFDSAAPGDEVLDVAFPIT